MHSTVINDRTLFIHDGDPRGGPLHIRRIKDKAWAKGKRWLSSHPHAVEDGDYEEIEIPYNDAQSFVAEMVRRIRVSQMEDASDEQILGIDRT